MTATRHEAQKAHIEQLRERGWNALLAGSIRAEGDGWHLFAGYNNEISDTALCGATRHITDSITCLPSVRENTCDGCIVGLFQVLGAGITGAMIQRGADTSSTGRQDQPEYQGRIRRILEAAILGE